MEATVLPGPGAKVRPQRPHTQGDRHNIQSVDRALYLLETIAEAGGEATLTELATRTNLNISTCHHLLATLIQRGLAWGSMFNPLKASPSMPSARAFSTSGTPACRSICRVARNATWKR